MHINNGWDKQLIAQIFKLSDKRVQDALNKVNISELNIKEEKDLNSSGKSITLNVKKNC